MKDGVPHGLPAGMMASMLRYAVFHRPAQAFARYWTLLQSDRYTDMARIPSPEHILVEVHQSLGLERPASKHIGQFTQLGFPPVRQKAFLDKLVGDIFSALEMDEQARADAWSNMREWFTFDSASAAHTWTHGASQRQVLWHLLAYSWVPELARRLAFWSLAGARRGIPFDAGMPGGAFWFMPTLDADAGTVRLPMEGVLDWLIDLLGDQSLEQAAGALQREQAPRENMHALRTLQGWRLEGRLPQSARVIDELFHDDATLTFEGSFYPCPDAGEEEQLVAALGFVRRRQLTPESLEHEIPMRAARLRAILGGDGPADDNRAFVEALAIRYAAPSMRLVRQRLRIARMAQDGYRRLVKALCATGTDLKSADPAHNRLLPLIALFQTVYNLTIQSSAQGETDEEQDRWFESKFAPWDQCDLLLSIMPSARGFGHRMLGERLTRRFMALGADAPLPDLVPFGDADQASSTIMARIRMLEAEADEDARIASLRTAAATPTQLADALVAELALLLDGPAPARTKDAKEHAERLLQELEAGDPDRVFKAPLLRFRARHRLALNDFEGAATDFRAALQACFEQNHGTLQTEIAHEGLATEVAMRGMDFKKQAFWYRHLVPPAWSTEQHRSFEDTALWCEDFFWTALYQPYEGVEARSGKPTAELENLLLESIGVIHAGGPDRLRSWLQRHEKKLRRLTMKDVRGDNLLLLWLKQLSNLERAARRPVRLGALRPNLDRPGAAMRRAIAVLVELWPEQARSIDFKRQTPLMIAADDGDAELTGLFASLSDVDAQDYLGRTALHAAVTGGSSRCVGIVLGLNPDVDKVTTDEGQTALHTAVRFGDQIVVSLIADAFPCRLDKRNLAGLTPLEMARDLIDNYEEWRDFMRRQNRRSGSVENFQAIVSFLETAPA